PGTHGRSSGAHLQSRSRRSARNRPRRAEAPGRGSPRGNRARLMPITGVVLMTYGSPRDLDDVGAYVTRVRGGREPDAALLAEFRRRYSTIGMSPLIEITQQQANALSDLLGSDYEVTPGMRFSEPSIAT